VGAVSSFNDWNYNRPAGGKLIKLNIIINMPVA